MVHVYTSCQPITESINGKKQSSDMEIYLDNYNSIKAKKNLQVEDDWFPVNFTKETNFSEEQLNYLKSRIEEIKSKIDIVKKANKPKI